MPEGEKWDQEVLRGYVTCHWCEKLCDWTGYEELWDPYLVHLCFFRKKESMVQTLKLLENGSIRIKHNHNV